VDAVREPHQRQLAADAQIRRVPAVRAVEQVPGVDELRVGRMLVRYRFENPVDDGEALSEARAVGDRQAEPERRDPGCVELAGDALDASSVLRDPRG